MSLGKRRSKLEIRTLIDHTYVDSIGFPVLGMLHRTVHKKLKNDLHYGPKQNQFSTTLGYNTGLICPPRNMREIFIKRGWLSSVFLVCALCQCI